MMHRHLPLRLSALLFGFVLSFCFCANPAGAQTATVGPYADAAGTQSTMQVNGFLPFDVYVVAHLPDPGLKGFDLGIEYPPDLFVLSTTVIGGGINVAPPDSDDWLVGLSTCFDDPSPVLLHISLGYFAGPIVPADTPLCLRPSNLGDPNGPAYADCDMAPHPLALAPEASGPFPAGCLVMNPSWECPTYEWFVDIPETYAEPNTSATVPLRIAERLASPGKCTIVGPYFVGVEVTLSYDPGFATWTGADLGPIMDGWNLEVEATTPGEVTLRALSPDVATHSHSFFEGNDVFLLHFDVGDGATVLATTSQRLIEDTNGDWTLIGDSSFLYTDPEDPIGVETTSFGTLKSRY